MSVVWTRKLNERAHKLKQAKQLKLKSDVAQFTTTFKPVNNLICCKTGLMWVAKRAISLFNLLYSNVARQVARFLLPVFTHLYLFNWRVHLVRYWTHYICFGLFSYSYTLSVIVLKLWVAPRKMFYNDWYAGVNEGETNCGIAQILAFYWRTVTTYRYFK